MVVPPNGGNAFADAVSFLLEVMNSTEVKMATRISIAMRLLPYTNGKLPDLGKKDRAELAAMSGRFAVRGAPSAAPDWTELLDRN